MKIERQKEKFTEITIRIENEKDLEFIRYILGAAYRTFVPCHFEDERSRGMGEKVEKFLKEILNED